MCTLLFARNPGAATDGSSSGLLSPLPWGLGADGAPSQKSNRAELMPNSCRRHAELIGAILLTYICVKFMMQKYDKISEQ